MENQSSAILFNRASQLGHRIIGSEWACLILHMYFNVLLHIVYIFCLSTVLGLVL